MDEIIDWGTAARVGVALMRPGPKLAPAERMAAVARLREAADRAAELVAAASHLPNAEAATHGTTLVVDRAGVVRANAAAMATVFAGLGEAGGDDGPQSSRAGFGRLVVTRAKATGAKATGTGAGVVLAVVGSVILGQYEPFSNRLLLSAPTIEAVRAEIGASPADFALWVCLHEQTHRHQFAAAPWLRDYLSDLIRSATQDGGAPEDEASGEASGEASAVDGLGLVGAIGDSHVRAVVAEVTALMSLLEGYADMLMDAAGTAVIPSLPSIRAAFDERRRVKKYDPASLLRKAIGLGAKMDQYVVGKSFCETVRQQIGIDGLNVAFTSRQFLPTLDELRDPPAWIARCATVGTVPTVRHRATVGTVPIDALGASAPVGTVVAGDGILSPDSADDSEVTRRLPMVDTSRLAVMEMRLPLDTADRPSQAGAN